MENAIIIKNLKKSFKDLRVLKGVNLSVRGGDVFALLGPNGAGKTTIIKIMSTLLLPDSGTVLINKFDVQKEPDKVREVIGLTGQYAAVDEYLTGIENMEMMGRLYRLSGADAKKRGEELLNQFDLEEAARRIVKTYSGGMRRRLDLAISLIATPPIIFLDEPTTGLDPRSRLTMWEVIENLAKAGTTVLLTTQYMEEADRLADKIAVIDEGRVIAEGTSDKLKQKVGKERLELVISKESDLKKALSQVGSDASLDTKRRSFVIPMHEGVGQLKNILSKMENAKIKIESLSLHKPTMDDVFLTLTGHKVTEDEVEQKDEGA